MIMSVQELRTYFNSNDEDSALEAKLQALELHVRAYTNNNFQKRNFRIVCAIVSQKLFCSTNLFKINDTVQITGTMYNDGLYTIKYIEDEFIKLDKPLIDEPECTVTKVEYPADIKAGIVDLMKWELTNKEKAGISTEIISRHHVTYFDSNSGNTINGYPMALMGFIKPYMKARFGRGL